MRERNIEYYFKKLVESYGGEVRKLQWIGRRGAFDRLAVMPGGCVYFVELKAPGEKPDPHQQREIDRFEALGAECWVIDSFEGTDKLLVEWSKKRNKK